MPARREPLQRVPAVAADVAADVGPVGVPGGRAGPAGTSALPDLDAPDGIALERPRREVRGLPIAQDAPVEVGLHDLGTGRHAGHVDEAGPAVAQSGARGGV